MTVKLADVRRAAGLYYGIKAKDLISTNRVRDIARPRQVAMAVCRQVCGKSLLEIGQSFGGLDHTTVLHAIRATTRLAKDCSETRDALGAIPELAGRVSALRRLQEATLIREGLERGDFIPAAAQAV